jgi:N4 gp68-like protein
MDRTVAAKTVEEYLREVDYEEWEKSYVPTEFALKYMNFVKMVNAGKEDIQTSPLFHYRMVESLGSSNMRIANLCLRGAGKTVVMGEMLVLYLALFNELPHLGKCNVIIYVADSMENGAKSLRTNVEARYNHSEFLQQYIPEAKFTDSELVFKNIEGKETYVKLFGASSGVRGFKRNGDRPVLAILDDLISDEMANSKVQLEKVYDLIYKAVDNAMNPKRNKIIFSGTPFNKADPLYQAIESGAWEANVYPMCTKFPCARNEFNGAWKERFSYDEMMDKFQKAVKLGRVKAFNQELMLRIASDEDRVILDEDISWFKRKEILENKRRYNWYITTDFATSTHRKADYTVIGVWAVDNKQNRYLVDGALGRFLMNDTFNKIFDFVSKYNPMSVGIEVTGQQGGFVPLIKDEMLRRNIWFTVARGRESTKEGIAVRTNKMDRFRLTEPVFKQKKFFLPEEMKDSILIQELLEELSTVTIDGIKAVHDDAIDMVSQLDQMVIIYPSEQQANLGKGTSQEMDDIDPFFNETNTGSDLRINDYLV